MRDIDEIGIRENTMDHMNAYERVMGVLNGKRPDYPPVVLMAREWCSKQAGFDLIDELDSVERHALCSNLCCR